MMSGDVPEPLPDVRRSDVGLVLIGEWTTDGPERQRAAVDAAVAAWSQVGWPDGLWSYTAFAATDGISVMHYSQWSDAATAREFAGTTKNGWTTTVDAFVPGITRDRVMACYPYRGFRQPSPVAETVGCVVLVNIEASDPASGKAWMDSMIELHEREEPAPGMLSATFHPSTDGHAIRNYAEWTSAEAHRSLVDGPRSADVLRLTETPGPVHPLGFKRYSWWRTVTAPEN